MQELPPQSEIESGQQPNSLEHTTEPFEYKLLTGHRKQDGSYKTGQQLRMEYIQDTDSLIYEMTNGLKVSNPAEGTAIKRPDVVIWLDKSARPVAWLTKELWPKLAADPQTGEVPKMPDFKFLNIDREQWVNTLDSEGSGAVDINRVDTSIIRSLRSIFVPLKAKKDGLTERIDRAPASLDDKTIMIVDEVYTTGRTLQYAEKLIQRAFPTAWVGGSYWMKLDTYSDKSGLSRNNDVPVWYDQNHWAGRGVANRNDRLSGLSENTTQRLGRYFLSTRPVELDKKSKQLRAEIHQLATNPDVPLRPSTHRSVEDIKMRLEALNDMPRSLVLEKIHEIARKR